MKDLSDILSFTEEQLNSLNDTERELAIKILNEYAESGTSKTLMDLYYAEYKEIPVDIITFIKDPHYLGKAWHLPSGKCKLFPYWEERLKELFPSNIATSVNTAIFTGARGLGKSEIAVTCGLYLMHRLMCLKNPYETLNLKPTEQVAFAFMNITKILAESIGITKFQNTVKVSPWFLERGKITGTTNKVWNPPDFIKIIIGSEPSHTIGQAVYFVFFDEIDFVRNKDIEVQKQKAMDMVDTAVGGMKTRFTYRGKNPTLLTLASSKRSEKSFLETYLKNQVKQNGGNLFIVDEPVWAIRPPEEYSGKKFKVAVGNKFLANEIVSDDSDVVALTQKGYKVIDVPVEYLDKFKDDIDRALCDYAGIASNDLTKYISGIRWQTIIDHSYQNPFVSEIIQVGNAPDDSSQYYEMFDMSKVDKNMMSKPLFIHLDMSVSGDRTGIAGVWIAGKKPHVDGIPDSKEVYFRLAFSVAIEAPKGFQISFEKSRNFIRWLREQGFNIKGISSDSFQSADFKQIMISEHFNYSTLSVDKVSTEKVCVPYNYFKNTIYEERLKVYSTELLSREILDLERDSNGRIDHPDHGRTGSKDSADSVCGAVYNASLHAEEFAYDFGEAIDSLLQANTAVQGSELIKNMAQEMLGKIKTKNMQTGEEEYSDIVSVDSPSGFDDNIFFW